MVAAARSKPFSVTIQPDGWFNLGWIDAIVGSEKREFFDPDSPVLDTDIDAYVDGYDMAKETRFQVPGVMRGMRERNQLVVT